MDPIISRLTWGVSRLPLRRPYHLSFATLTEFAAVWVRYEDEMGRVGLGEAVALPGYSWETTEDICAAVAEITQGAQGLPRSMVEDRCLGCWARRPFAASAVMTALRLPELLEKAPLGRAVPLNFPVAGDAEPARLRSAIGEGLRQGYRYIKVKVGRDLDRELANLPILLAEEREREFEVVFDANQGFSLEQALVFAEALAARDHGRLLWFEQPLDRLAWSELSELVAQAPVKVVIDESIYSADDVARAADMRAYGVKMKLFKQLSPGKVLELAELARSLGLRVVLGNGVSTDVGNLAEYGVMCLGEGLFVPPAECNGLQKLSTPLLAGLLEVEGGSLVCRASGSEVASLLASRHIYPAS